MIPEDMYELFDLKPSPSSDSKEMEIALAIATKNLNMFQESLNSDTYFKFKEITNTGYSPLAIICMQHPDPIFKEFVGAVTRSDIDLNYNGTFSNEEGFVHLAVKSGNHYALEALINAKSVDVNAQNSEGDTALHYLANLEPKDMKEDENKFEKCMNILLSNENIDINCANFEDFTPIHRAAYKNNDLLIEKLLQREDLDLDHSWPIHETQRECLLRTKFMDRIDGIPVRQLSHSILFTTLKSRPDKFIKLLTSKSPDFIEKCAEYVDPSSKMGFLQHAVKHNNTEAVQIMISHKFNPYVFGEYDDTAFAMALSEANIEILKIIMASPIQPTSAIKQEWSPLHHLVMYARKKDEKCLEFFLPHMETYFFDVHDVDKEGETALHVAIQYGTEMTILLLLKYGWKLNAKNNSGKQAIELMDPKILSNFLDKQIKFSPDDDEFVIDYSFLVDCRKKYELEPKIDMRLLLTLGGSESTQNVLKNVVISSLIALKWRQTRHLFLHNILVFLIFCSALTWYSITYSYPSWILLVVAHIALIIRESIQFMMNPKKYSKDYENGIEITIIILTSFILIYDCSDASICTEILSIIILLSWIDLLLILGRHPFFSVKIEMFRLVSYTFVTYLSVYMLMIMGFALSFYVLFKNDTSEGNPFNELIHGIFKTLIMTSGEFEGGNFKFDEHPYTSRFIFFLFVILVALVLVNLLNGLAVYDTREIRDDALTLSFVTYLKYISAIEETLENSQNWGRFGKYLYRKFIRFPKQLVFNKRTKIFYFEISQVTTVACMSDYLGKYTRKAVRDVIRDQINLKNEEEREEMNDELAKLVENTNKLLQEQHLIINNLVTEVNDIKNSLKSFKGKG